MRRRVISTLTVALAVVSLGFVLISATVVDRRAPSVVSIRVSAPVEDDPQLAHRVTAIDIRFSEAVRTETVEPRFRIVPEVPGAITWHGQTAAIFTPTERLPAETEFTVSIEPGFEDLAGNVAPTGVVAWTFRTVGPPEVVAVQPEDGSTGIALDATVTLRFDRLMDTEAVARSVSVDPPAAVRHTWSGEELTLAFGAPLRFGTTYTVTVGATAADTSGSPLAEPFVARFTTVPAGLRVERVLPADRVAGISVRSPIAVVFDRAIDAASITSALHVTPQVDGTLSVIDLPSDEGPRTAGNERGRVLLFTPGSPLAANTTYTVTLDPVVRRLQGNDVAAGLTWSFTTGQPTLSAQNQVAFLSARTGVTNVWVMNPDGSNPRQLTAELAPVTAFDASGDGGTIAWATAGAVRVMQIDGTGERTLTAVDRFEYAPRLAPDGRSLLVGRRDANGEDLGWWLLPMPGVLDVETRRVLDSGAPPIGSSRIPSDGSETAEAAATWGQRAAFDGGGRLLLVAPPGDTLRLVRLDSPDEAAVETGLVADAPPVWSARLERFVVVAAERNASTYVWYVDAEGRTSRIVEAAGSAAASGNGLLAFLTRSPDGVTHVAVVDAASGARSPRVLTEDGNLDDRWPAFGPGGEALLFGRVRAGEPAPSIGIWLADVATGRLARLSTDGAWPRWLP